MAVPWKTGEKDACSSCHCAADRRGKGLRLVQETVLVQVRLQYRS